MTLPSDERRSRGNDVYAQTHRPFHFLVSLIENQRSKRFFEIPRYTQKRERERDHQIFNIYIYITSEDTSYYVSRNHYFIFYCGERFEKRAVKSVI